MSGSIPRTRTDVTPRFRCVARLCLAAALISATGLAGAQGAGTAAAGEATSAPGAATPVSGRPAAGAPERAPDTVAGHVKTVSGEAYVVHGGTRMRAEPGLPIHVGAVLRTGPDGTLGATLKDNTRIAFGPGSEFRIEDFRYAPAEGRLGLAATLLRGTLDFVSGIVTRLRPESTVLRTPTSTVGIRGTHILVKVDE